jgi:Domain of unknown function (DUF4105)
MKFVKKFSLLILIYASSTFSQFQKLSETAKISILTCGSGNELYSIYGHTAIRINDPENNLDTVYNYGYFDFNTPNFYLKFVKGDLQYFVAVDSFQSFMAEYVATNRSVSEQELILSIPQKQQLFDELNTSLFSDQRFYTYKFIDKNCTTMVLDKVNSVFGKKIISKKSINNDSYRKVLYQYLTNHFWENLGINIIFGTKVDNKATKLFLPIELLENLKTTKFHNQPIVKQTVVLNEKLPETSNFSFWNSIYLFLLLLFLILFLNKKNIFLIYFVILGSIGLFFSLVGFYSFHQEIWWNYNVLLFNPTLLFLVFFIKKSNMKWVSKLLFLNLGCIVVYIFWICNKVDFLIILPLILTSTIILLKFKITKSLPPKK